MVSVSQVSIEKEDSDVPRERVQNEVEDADVARKRHIQEVRTTTEIIGIDEVSDAHSTVSVIQASSKRPKVDYNAGSVSFKFSREKKDYDVLQNKVEDSDVARKRRFQEVSTTKEIGIDEVSDSYSSGSEIKVSSKRPKADYLKEQKSLVEQKPCSHKGDDFFCKKLFQKVLSPTDVACNRLLIPKEFAVTHLRGTPNCKPSEIVCYDRLKVEWKFTFKYYNDIYVFTSRWKAFIEANNLQAKDTVVFFSCQCPSEKHTTTALVSALGIDVKRHNDLDENDQQDNTLEKQDDENDQQDNTLEKEDDLLEKDKDLSRNDSNGSSSQTGPIRLFGKDMTYGVP